MMTISTLHQFTENYINNDYLILILVENLVSDDSILILN